jgi:hypothetical protein
MEHKYENILEHPPGTVFCASGRMLDINNPDPEIIWIGDIAHALSNMHFFGGHSKKFYSVAQHAVVLCEMADIRCKKEALLHFAPMAYLGMDPNPHAYTLLRKVMIKKYGQSIAAIELVDYYEDKAQQVAYEYIQLGKWSKWTQTMAQLDITKEALLPAEAHRLFQKYFLKYCIS